MLMIALGQEGAAEIMQFLSEAEIENLTQSIAEFKHLSVEMQDEVLAEFEQHLLAGEYLSQGGLEFARGTLERAVGTRKAQEILDRITGTLSSGFHLLKNVPPEQLAPFISHEHPQTIALILSQLDPRQGAGILSQLPEHTQSEVAYRIATMNNITPAVLKQIEDSLAGNLHDILSGNKDVGGPKVTADILNLTGTSVERSVLEHIDVQDPEVAETVRNMMFVFEDICSLSDREVQIVLREVEQKDLVIALKAASEEVKEKILSNMSERVRLFMEEEMEFLGPMRLSEVEAVQLRIVHKIRQLEDQGQLKISLKGGAGDTFV
ncbi:MAG: flagellar motor switch protein FliG [Candidatus Latescibacteria bacterium]|nr:flagellar motor switch protein FliG [Candidatus Latescibacterota bacterium]